MKRLLAVLAAAALLTGEAAAYDMPGVSAQSMILIHAPSGTVLAERNANARLPVASTTKLMTALVALETCADVDERVVIQPEYTRVEGSSAYLAPGDVYTLRELLYGLLLCSGNDAACAIACHTAGDIASFAALMNEKAEELGLRNSRFTNPHGLNDGDPRSSARDLALIMAAAMDNALFREITGAQRYVTHGQTYVNHNRLLHECPGVIGGKTGYTRAAGRCLVTCCEREGLELICVTLSAPDDWEDHTALYRWAYDRYACFQRPAGSVLAEVPVVAGVRAAVGAALADEVCLCLPVTAKVELKLSLPDFVFAAVEGGGRAGSAAVWVDGEERVSVPLVWAEDVEREARHRAGLRAIGIYYRDCSD